MTKGRRRLTAAAALIAALAVTLAGCGIQSTGISIVGAAPTGLIASANPLATPQADAQDGQISILLLQSGTNQLVWVPRTIDGAVNEASVAAALIKGPTETELKLGYYTDIPPELVVTPDALGQRAAYTLSPYVEWSPLARAQFICTMQEYDQSDSVGYTWSNSLAWVACKDTTQQPIYLPGISATAAASPDSGQ